MKSIVSLMMVLLMGAAVAAPAQAVKPMSLIDARTGIGEAVTNPKKVKETMKRLSPADQIAYVAALNAAIAKLPGSAEERIATYLTVNSEAVQGAAKGNLKAVVAEVFATAGVEALPVIHTQFAEKFFNRAGNASQTYSDQTFIKISGEVMKTVNERTATVDNGDARSGFAALMFLKASNTPTAPEMVDAMVETLPPASREVAKSEWFPAATASEPNYDDITAGAAVDVAPVESMIITIAGPQNHVALFGDLTGSFDSEVVGTITDVIFNPIQYAQAPMANGIGDAAIPDLEHGEYISVEEDKKRREPGGYPWQRPY